MSCAVSPELIQKTIDFHGHWCPGLAMGIRAAEWALNEMGKAGDEEIVALVETDMCGVDAIQYLTGCTFGKGNLIHQDLGKNAFSFYRRRDGKAARLLARNLDLGEDSKDMARLHIKMRQKGLTPEEEAAVKELRAKRSKFIMEAEFGQIFELKEPSTWHPARPLSCPP